MDRRSDDGAPVNVENAVAGTEVVTLFATPLWKTTLAPEQRAELTGELLARIERQTAPLEPLGAGERWQLPANLHRLAEFAPMRELVESGARSVLDYQRIIHQGIALTRCTAVIAPAGARATKPVSPNSYLSGIYCARGEVAARFDDPRPHAGLIAPLGRGGRAPRSQTETVAADEGVIMLMPAWLPCIIEWGESSERSTVLVFDLMLSAYSQMIGRPKWQGNRVHHQ